MKKENLMKKVIAIITMVCITTTTNLGLVTASASNSEQGGTIQPFASDVISSVSYGVTKSNYSATINFKGIYDGSVYLELQKKNGTTWDYYDSTTAAIGKKTNLPVSKSCTVSSGTYRIYLKVTVDGDVTERTSQSFTIS